MAVAFPSPGLKALSDALGLKRCKSCAIFMDVNDLVRVRTESYPTDDSLIALADAIVKGDYVLVPREEWDRVNEAATPAVNDQVKLDGSEGHA